MSGGRFAYLQYDIDRVADEVDFGVFEVAYTTETRLRFKQAARVLRVAAIMLNRVDWYVSGDDGEETFHQRWDDDFKKFREGNR